MQDNGIRQPQPKLARKLALNKETVRVLTDKELAGVEGGGGNTAHCSGGTCLCGTSCGNQLSTCPPPGP